MLEVLRERPRAGIAIVAALALLAFAPALNGEFVLDDRVAVVESACVSGSFDGSRILGSNFWCEPKNAQTSETWRPWTVAIWWPLWHLGGGASWPFHGLNMLLHLACSLVVVAVGRSLGASRPTALAAGPSSLGGFKEPGAISWGRQ